MEEPNSDHSVVVHNEGEDQKAQEPAALPTKEILEGQDDDEESRPDIMKIDMLVSSRHMALASPVFKAMLRPEGIKEGHTQRKAASKSPLPNDDPRAMRILLDVVHGHNRRVPRKVSLRTLASIAVLAVKYQMVEALESYSDVWINKLKSNLPTEYITAEGEKLAFRWMEIAWVFGKAKEFNEMTSLVQRGALSDLNTDVAGAFPYRASLSVSV